MFFDLLEFPCVRALLMSSGKTLSAFQGLDSMTHRRLDIVFCCWYILIQIIYLCHRCVSVQGMVATRTTPLHGPHMPTIQDLDQMPPLQLVSSYWFWAMNRDKGVTENCDWSFVTFVFRFWRFLVTLVMVMNYMDIFYFFLIHGRKLRIFFAWNI